MDAERETEAELIQHFGEYKRRAGTLGTGGQMNFERWCPKWLRFIELMDRASIAPDLVEYDRLKAELLI